MVVSELQVIASSSGIGTLGVSGSAFVIELITFVLGFLVLKKWAFGPIIKVLRERRETIEKGVNLGQAMEKEKAELEAKVAQELSDARVKADAILSDANEEAKQAIRQAEGDAEAKAAGIIKQAQEQTKQDVLRAKRQLEAEIVELVSDATEVLVGEKVDSKKDAKLIDKALAEAEK